MRGLIVLVPLLALVVIVAGIAALASLFPLQGVRDIAIVVLAALWVLMSVLVLTWVVLVIKDGVVPVLEKATSTLDTVQGTAQFLGESVVNSVVKAASAAAWIRGAMLRIVGRKRR